MPRGEHLNVTNRKRNKKKRKEIKSTAGQCDSLSTSNEQRESSGTSSLGFSLYSFNSTLM